MAMMNQKNIYLHLFKKLILLFFINIITFNIYIYIHMLRPTVKTIRTPLDRNICGFDKSSCFCDRCIKPKISTQITGYNEKIKILKKFSQKIYDINYLFRAVRILNAVFNDKKNIDHIALLIEEFLVTKQIHHVIKLQKDIL